MWCSLFYCTEKEDSAIVPVQLTTFVANLFVKNQPHLVDSERKTKSINSKKKRRNYKTQPLVGFQWCENIAQRMWKMFRFFFSPLFQNWDKKNERKKGRKWKLLLVKRGWRRGCSCFIIHRDRFFFRATEGGHRRLQQNYYSHFVIFKRGWKSVLARKPNLSFVLFWIVYTYLFKMIHEARPKS